MPTSDEVVPARSTWYVRTGLDRAMTATIDEVSNLYDDLEHRYPRLEEDHAGAWRVLDQLRGVASYQLQWAQEALDAFSDLPKEIRPVGLEEYRAKVAILLERRKKVWELRNANS